MIPTTKPFNTIMFYQNLRRNNLKSKEIHLLFNE